ncbi:hypothetical protein PVK06_047555 [Gossypium arboreum]|uniref:RNase H type-1 domain-containing protein n=1 Tax=Gossypium arboreum TaxID=29729 RepID=A0ABR0MDM2_GOSAR|nr:hypothetical protein PVK06_047555 [Gossypium arboreum]
MDEWWYLILFSVVLYGLGLGLAVGVLNSVLVCLEVAKCGGVCGLVAILTAVGIVRVRAGAGDVLRDSNGTWLVGFSAFCGNRNSSLAELWGIYHGIQVAWTAIRRIIIESDLATSVVMIRKG